MIDLITAKLKKGGGEYFFRKFGLCQIKMFRLQKVDNHIYKSEKTNKVVLGSDVAVMLA